MCPLLVLPMPLPSSDIALGQLLTDPLHLEHASLKPASAPIHKEQINAEKMVFTAIEKPSEVFDNLRTSSTTRSFLRKMANQNQPVYFVTGMQTLHKPSFKRIEVEHGLAAGATNEPFCLPVRRVDSASSVGSITEKAPEEYVLAVELCKVRCRVGDRNEPHFISDLDYNWSYHTLEDDVQLSIGLGRPLEASEMRLLGVSESEDSYEDDNHDSCCSSSDDGFAGF